MSNSKPVLKGLACAFFGAAAMYLYTQHEINTEREQAFEAITYDFVTSNILQAVPELFVHAGTLIEAGKDYLRENNAVLCDAFESSICYLDADAEEGLGLQILDAAFGICDEHPVELERACAQLVEYADSLLKSTTPEGQSETPTEEPPAHENEASPFYLDTTREPRLMV